MRSESNGNQGVDACSHGKDFGFYLERNGEPLQGLSSETDALTCILREPLAALVRIDCRGESRIRDLLEDSCGNPVERWWLGLGGSNGRDKRRRDPGCSKAVAFADRSDMRWERNESGMVQGFLPEHLHLELLSTEMEKAVGKAGR